MKYYGYTMEQLDKMTKLLDAVSVTGINQIKAFGEAVGILMQPLEMEVPEEGGNNDNEEIHKD